MSKILILKDGAAPRRNEPDTHHVTIGVRKAHERQWNNSKVRLSAGCTGSGMAAHNLGNHIAKAGSAIPAQQGVTKRLGDKGEGTKIRHHSGNVLEKQPPSAKGASVALPVIRHGCYQCTG